MSLELGATGSAGRGAAPATTTGSANEHLSRHWRSALERELMHSVGTQVPSSPEPLHLAGPPPDGTDTVNAGAGPAAAPVAVEAPGASVAGTLATPPAAPAAWSLAAGAVLPLPSPLQVVATAPAAPPAPLRSQGGSGAVPTRHAPPALTGPLPPQAAAPQRTDDAHRAFARAHLHVVHSADGVSLWVRDASQAANDRSVAHRLVRQLDELGLARELRPQAVYLNGRLAWSAASASSPSSSTPLAPSEDSDGH